MTTIVKLNTVSLCFGVYSMHENVKKDLSECQQNNLQLKEELKTAVEAKHLAEATATK